MRAAVQSARDLTLIQSQRREVRRWKGIEGTNPIFQDFQDLSENWSVRKFETNCLPTTRRQLSLLRSQTRLSNFPRSRINIEIRRKNELLAKERFSSNANCTESREDANVGCRGIEWGEIIGNPFLDGARDASVINFLSPFQ